MSRIPSTLPLAPQPNLLCWPEIVIVMERDERRQSLFFFEVTLYCFHAFLWEAGTVNLKFSSSTSILVSFDLFSMHVWACVWHSRHPSLTLPISLLSLHATLKASKGSIRTKLHNEMSVPSSPYCSFGSSFFFFKKKMQSSKDSPLVPFVYTYNLYRLLIGKGDGKGRERNGRKEGRKEGRQRLCQCIILICPRFALIRRIKSTIFLVRSPRTFNQYGNNKTSYINIRTTLREKEGKKPINSAYTYMHWRVSYRLNGYYNGA